MKVALFDYGAGNLHSLRKGLEAGGADVEVTDRWDRALSLDAVVLPGVGSFGAATGAVEGQQEEIRQALDDGLPCLGICLGMQLLLSESEEARGRGIGRVPGRVRRLRSRVIPHMGWNDVAWSGPHGAPLFGEAVPGGLVAYFANSFVCEPRDPEVVVAWTEHGGDRFPAALRLGSTWGVQFHPEKSSRAGLGLLRGFLRWAEGVRRSEEPTAGPPAPGRGSG